MSRAKYGQAPGALKENPAEVPGAEGERGGSPSRRPLHILHATPVEYPRQVGRSCYDTDRTNVRKWRGQHAVGDAGHHVAAAGRHQVDARRGAHSCRPQPRQLRGSQAVIGDGTPGGRDAEDNLVGDLRTERVEHQPHRRRRRPGSGRRRRRPNVKVDHKDARKPPACAPQLHARPAAGRARPCRKRKGRRPRRRPEIARRAQARCPGPWARWEGKARGCPACPAARGARRCSDRRHRRWSGGGARPTRRPVLPGGDQRPSHRGAAEGAPPCGEQPGRTRLPRPRQRRPASARATPFLPALDHWCAAAGLAARHPAAQQVLQRPIRPSQHRLPLSASCSCTGTAHAAPESCGGPTHASCGGRRPYQLVCRRLTPEERPMRDRVVFFYRGGVGPVRDSPAAGRPTLVPTRWACLW
eukprot:scaffold23726_cov130-Isochrysis_galbana.AAC.4